MVLVDELQVSLSVVVGGFAVEGAASSQLVVLSVLLLLVCWAGSAQVL